MAMHDFVCHDLFDFPPEDTEDVLLNEPPAITSVKTNSPSSSERNKYSTPSASAVALVRPRLIYILRCHRTAGSSCSSPANLHSQMSPYSGSSSSTPTDLHFQMSPYSHISSDQTQGLYHQDKIGGLDILSQAMVGMCDAGTHHADLNNFK
ncbi:hypothetical protein J6590_101137 [Homalodisca vitripennis]|nr:hypothetical protein J6590_101137 [Homalodisca vitripennis]